MSRHDLFGDACYLTRALQESYKVYRLDCGVYLVLNEKNRDVYEERQQEMLAFWQGMLGLTEEETAVLTDVESYVSYDEKAVLEC